MENEVHFDVAWLFLRPIHFFDETAAAIGLFMSNIYGHK
jgi:hypothetical protein